MKTSSRFVIRWTAIKRSMTKYFRCLGTPSTKLTSKFNNKMIKLMITEHKLNRCSPHIRLLITEYIGQRQTINNSSEITAPKNYFVTLKNESINSLRWNILISCKMNICLNSRISRRGSMSSSRYWMSARQLSGALTRTYVSRLARESCWRSGLRWIQNS